MVKVVSAGSILGLGIVAIALIFFAGAGGIERTRAFAQQFRPGTDLIESQPSIPTLQKELADTQSSQTALISSANTQIASSNIADKRKFKPPVQGVVTTKIDGVEFIDRPTAKDVKSLSGIGTAQLSTGGIARLTPEAIDRIRKESFTAQELEDIKNLDLRRKEAIKRGINPNIKLTGTELVLRKREQAEISKAFLTKQFGPGTFTNGKLFANPLFETGGKTQAEVAEIQRQKAEDRARIQRSIELQNQREKVGAEIAKSVGTTFEEQNQALKTRNIALRGGSALNNKALARLRELGLI